MSIESSSERKMHSWSIQAFGIYYLVAAASLAFESCVKVAVICSEAKVQLLS